MRSRGVRPRVFARYERDSEENDAPEISADEDSEGPEQICLDAFGACLFDFLFQIFSGGRADSMYDDDVERFIKAVALELP